MADIKTSTLNKILAEKKLKPSTVALIKSKFSDQEVASLTPPMNPDGSRPSPASDLDKAKDQAAADARSGDWEVPGVNSNPNYNPTNPYAREGFDPKWKAPKAQDAGEALGDVIVDKIERTFSDGTPSQVPATPSDKKGEGEGDKVVDRSPVDEERAAAQAQVAAQQAAQAAYNKALDKYKVSTRDNFDKTIKAANDKLQKDYEESGELAEKQGEETAEKVTAAGDALYAQAKLDADAEQKKRESENENLKRRVDEMDKINDELLNSKVDENHWFSSKNLGQKIVMGIAGILQSGAERRNVLQDTINQDIKIQMENYDRKAKGLAGKNSLYGRMREIYGDDREGREKARLATRIAFTNYVNSRMDALAARHSGEKGKQNASIAKDQLGASLAQDSFKLESMLNPPPGTAAATGGASTKKLEASAHDYSQELEKAQIPSMESQLASVEKMSAKGGATFGNATKALTELPGGTSVMGMINPEATLNEQALESLALTRRHMLTGSAASEKEDKRIAMSIWGDRSPEAIKNGLSLIRKEMEDKRASIAAGHDPQAVLLHGLREKNFKQANSRGNVDQAKANIPGLKKN